MYSTCTINRSENEDNADWICTSLGFTGDGEYVQMLPSPDKDNDGFFVARLIKKQLMHTEMRYIWKKLI